MLQRNSTLKDLDLSFNPDVSDTGAIFIAQGLKQNSYLRVLKLDSCHISDEGVESLGEALVKNDSLKKLSLWDFRGTSVRRLSECLKANRGLVDLTLTRHFRSARIQEIINAVRRRNRTPLISVHYS